MRQNALWNCKNPNQGDFKKILCVCSAGLLRSPTLAYILAEKYNTRSCGLHDYALIQFDEILMEWADIILCANAEMARIIESEYNTDKVIALNIPDIFPFRDPELITLATEQLKEKGLL